MLRMCRLVDNLMSYYALNLKPGVSEKLIINQEER